MAKPVPAMQFVALGPAWGRHPGRHRAVRALESGSDAGGGRAGAGPARCELSTEPWRRAGQVRRGVPGAQTRRRGPSLYPRDPAPAVPYSRGSSAPVPAPAPPAAARARRSSSSERGGRPGAAGAGAHAAGATGPSSTQRRLLLLNLLGSRMSSTEKEVGRGGGPGRAAPAPSGAAGTVSLAASGGAPARGKAGSSARPSMASRAAAAAGAGGAGPGPGGGGGSAGPSPVAAGPLALMPASRRSGPSGYWAPIPGGPGDAARSRAGGRGSARSPCRPALGRCCLAPPPPPQAPAAPGPLIYGGPAGGAHAPTRRTHVRPQAAAGSAALVSARA